MREGISQLPFFIFILLVLVIVVSTTMLCRKRVTPRIRGAFLIAGVLVVGFIFSWLILERMGPNPVLALRTILVGISQVAASSPVAGNRAGVFGIVMILLLLGISWISSKSYRGWYRQLGLLQDSLYRVRLPKWRPPSWLSNGVRILVVTTGMSALASAGLDFIGLVDPFQLFRFSSTLASGLFAFLLLAVSLLFTYQLSCPFGLGSWLVEQISVMQPRINLIHAGVASYASWRALPGPWKTSMAAG